MAASVSPPVTWESKNTSCFRSSEDRMGAGKLEQTSSCTWCGRAGRVSTVLPPQPTSVSPSPELGGIGVKLGAHLRTKRLDAMPDSAPTRRPASLGEP